LEPALIVTTEEAVAGFVPNVAVIPVGQLNAASVTPALKPFAGVIVTVDVPVDPTFAVAAVAFIVKLGAALTVSEIVVLADNAPLVPLTVSV
jgi:hypothetical protein